MKNNRTILLTLTCSMFALIACQLDRSSAVDESKLPGKYCFNGGGNYDSLFLFDDKTYVHKHLWSKTGEMISKGSWNYDSAGLKIVFDDFIFYNEEGPANSSDGIWVSKVYVTNEGEIRLMYSKENNIFFYKK